MVNNRSSPNLSKHYCHLGGRLVNGLMAIPSAPFDYVWEKGPLIGCNNLFCKDCNSPVMQWPGLALRANAGRFQVPTSQPGWEKAIASGIFDRDPESRLYGCCCSVRTETQFRDLEAEEDDFTDPVPSWYCAGHPPLVPGDSVDGIPINNDANLVSSIQASLAGNNPAAAPDFTAEYPACWVHRLYRVFHPDKLAGAISRMVATHLTATEPRLRGGALDFFRREPLAPGVERLAESAIQTPDLFVGVDDACNPGHDLAHTLRIALAQRAEASMAADGLLDPSTRQAMRLAVLWSTPNPLFFFRTALRVDRTWMCANINEILGTNPTDRTASDLLYILVSELGEEAIPTILDLPNGGILTRQRLATLVESSIQDPTKTVILSGLR